MGRLILIIKGKPSHCYIMEKKGIYEKNITRSFSGMSTNILIASKEINRCYSNLMAKILPEQIVG